MDSTKKSVSDIENRIGTTESGEIAYNLDAFDRLYKGNIIITKRLTDKLINKLIGNSDKIIFHCCVTGMGSTRIRKINLNRFLHLVVTDVIVRLTSTR